MTNESLRISGFESLILETSAGKENLDIPASILKMFPNPFKNSAKLEFHQSVPGDALIEIHNLAGQTVLKANQYLYPGRHSFEISLNYPGIFFINIINDNIKSSIKAVCIETNESKPLIRHLGISGFEENRLRSGTNKNIKTMRSNSSIALMLMKKHTK